MGKRLAVLLLMGVSVLVLSGCATTKNKVCRENDDLKIQNQNLQIQLKQKEDEVEGLKLTLSGLSEEKSAAAKFSQPFLQETAIDHPQVKDIQAALRNAGYDSGSLDGKMGKKTRQMIRNFQKANGLDADGKVGKKTWGLLSTYLEKTAVKE